jgi:hypothetical protein
MRFAIERNLTGRSTILSVAEASGEPIPRWARFASFGYFLLFLVLYGAVFAGLALQSRAAAYVAVAGFVATLTVHVVVAVVNYRRVMRSDWPKVDPLEDDDDWDAT